MSFVCQQEKKSVWNTENRLSRICCMTEWDHSEFTKNKDNYKLTEIHKTEENTDFSRSDELLLMICCITLSHSEILDMFHTEKQKFSLKCRARKNLYKF